MHVMGHIICKHCASMSKRKHSLLCTLEKLRRAIITFIMSVCLSVCSSTRLSVEGFSLNFIFEESLKTSEENFKFNLKSDKNSGTLHKQRYFT